MPTYQFEAMDASGQEIKDVIEAASEEEAQVTIRQMGYYVTKIAVKKQRKGAAKKSASGNAKGKTFVLGGVKAKQPTNSNSGIKTCFKLTGRRQVKQPMPRPSMQTTRGDSQHHRAADAGRLGIPPLRSITRFYPARRSPL